MISFLIVAGLVTYIVYQIQQFFVENIRENRRIREERKRR